MKGGERVQLSILMPILRTEIARLEITPDEILLVDRMNKRYVRASRSELNDIENITSESDHLPYPAEESGRKAKLHPYCPLLPVHSAQ